MTRFTDVNKCGAAFKAIIATR